MKLYAITIIWWSVNKMVCSVCGSEDFYIEEDEFGDLIYSCMVCGEEYLNVDDDEDEE